MLAGAFKVFLHFLILYSAAFDLFFEGFDVFVEEIDLIGVCLYRNRIHELNKMIKLK